MELRLKNEEMMNIRRCRQRRMRQFELLGALEQDYEMKRARILREINESMEAERSVAESIAEGYGVADRDYHITDAGVMVVED